MYIDDAKPRALKCRACDKASLSVFLDLGVQPVANALLDRDDLGGPESRYPLQLAFCRNCALVQVTYCLPAETLFGRNYPYYSSFSPAVLAHSREHALSVLAERKLSSESLVVEVASNDGYLLQNFVAHGVPVLGIDPAEGPVAAAREIGVNTEQAYFGADLARKLAAEGRRADVLFANNVIAHVDDIHDFVEGMAALLKKDGVALLEFAYLRDMIEKCEFDTIYHEHLFYHSLTALGPIFEAHGLFLNDAQRLPIHGGSLRIRLSKVEGKTERLNELLREEAALGMNALPYYLSFAARVTQKCEDIVTLMRGIRGRGARIAAYGAAAKGATLLNYANIGPDLLDYVVDRNTHKVGKYMPGVKLPIRPVDCLTEDAPDYVLVLAWNFGAEIMEQNAGFMHMGGRFIMPLPHLQVI